MSNRLKDLFLSSWHPFAWFFLIGFLVYGQTLFFGFSYFDDNVLILDRLHQLQNVSYLGNLFRDDVFHLTQHPGSYYRPLLMLSFMGDALIAGANPMVFHCTNILLHLCVVCLLFVLLTKIFQASGQVFWFSLFFLVHPAAVQAVAWLPGRNDLLLGLFVLSSFLFFIDFVRRPGLGNGIGHFLFFGLALFTKESAVALPVLCVAYTFAERKKTTAKPPVLFYIFWLFSLGLWFFCRSAALKTSGLGLSTSVGAIFLNSPSLLLYFGKIFFPFNLSVFPILRDSFLGWGVLAVVGVLFVLYLSKKKDLSFVIFGFAWFLIFVSFALLRATSQQVPADFLEHRLYVPMIGVIIALLATGIFSSSRPRKKAVLLVAVAVLLLFSFLNVGYARNFQNKISFWQRAVQDAPDASLTHANLGAMYYLEEKFEPAAYEYQQALALNPRQEMVYNNLALIFEKQGRLAEAEQGFFKELAMNPRYADGYFNLGLLRYRQKRIEEARQLMRQAIGVDPDHVGARQALAVDYFHSGREADLKQCLQDLKQMNVFLTEDFLKQSNLW